MNKIIIDSSLDMEKVVDLNMFVADRKKVQKVSKVIILICAVIIIAIGLILFDLLFILLGVFFLTFGLMYKKFNRFIVTWVLGKKMDEVRRSTMTITEEGLSDESKNGYSKFEWKEIYEITEDHKNVYIFISKIQAFVLRKTDFNDGELTNFWNMLPADISVNRKS